MTARSSAFSGTRTPTVYGLGVPLVVSRIDDSTLTLRLPVAPSGEVVLSSDAAGHDTVGVAHVTGMNRHRGVAGGLGFEPLALLGPGGVVFVAQSGPASYQLVFLDPNTDQVATITGLEPVEEGFGIQTGFQPNRFVLRDSTGLLGVWQLFPQPAFVDSSARQTTSARHQAQLDDTTWLTTFSRLLQVTTPSGTRSSTAGQVGDPLRLVYSPDGSRIALVVASAFGQRVPILEGATGDTLYSVHTRGATGAAFSPHADRLYYSSFDYVAVGPTDSLFAYRATDGHFLYGAQLPPGYRGYALAVDPKVDRLYQVAESSGTHALLVYDGSTFTLLGQLTCPGACGTTEPWSAGLGVDALTGSIHVAYSGSPAPVITYDRLP